MKKIKYILLVGLPLWACNDQLDLYSPQAIVNEVALNSDANVKTVLMGLYDAASDGDVYGGNALRNAELLGADDELVFSGTFGDPSEIWRKEITTVNIDVANYWMDSYRTINIANNILSAIEVVNEEDRSRIAAEARFIRGLVYFDLVRYFSKPYNAGTAAADLGVPIVVTPNSTEAVERSSVADVYAQAVADLVFAETNLPATNGYYASSIAASALLARLYLQQSDFTNARDAANRAIAAADAEGYELVGDIAEAFNNSANSTEDIFAIQVSTQDGVNNMQLFFASASNGGRGDIEIQTKHLNLYNAADARGDFFYVDPATGDTRTSKWTNQFGVIPMIRLTELYLIRAETNIRLGSSVGDTPANDLDRIRSRAGLARIDAPVLSDVLNERKLELAFEGHLIHDIKRLGGTADGFTAGANELVFPIPQRERNINPDLSQNPGYE